MEDALEAIRDAQITITKEIVDWLLHCLDSIKFLVSETSGGRPEKTELLDEIARHPPLSVRIAHRSHRLDCSTLVLKGRLALDHNVLAVGRPR